MNLSAFQIALTVGLFLLVTFVLVKFTYKRFEKEYGPKTWKIDGSRSSYFRILTLLSITITVVLMLVLKNTVLPDLYI